MLVDESADGDVRSRLGEGRPTCCIELLFLSLLVDLLDSHIEAFFRNLMGTRLSVHLEATFLLELRHICLVAEKHHLKEVGLSLLELLDIHSHFVELVL